LGTESVDDGDLFADVDVAFAPVAAASGDERSSLARADALAGVVVVGIAA